MAMLQADNRNYSPGIVPLMPCHLHVSQGVLHAQRRSVVGTSQETPDVSGQATQSQTQPLPGKGVEVSVMFPLVFPQTKPVLSKILCS